MDSSPVRANDDRIEHSHPEEVNESTESEAKPKRIIPMAKKGPMNPTPLYVVFLFRFHRNICIHLGNIHVGQRIRWP